MKNEVLSDEQIRRFAPSVFAESPKNDVSSLYEFVPTSHVLYMLRNEGWQVSKAQEQRTNNSENAGFQKHMLRFRREELRQNGEYIELVLINSHNRTTAFQLMAGIYRLVCSNGMIVGDTFDRISVKHIGHTADEIVEASYEVIESAPLIADKMNGFKAIELSQPERKVYAESAALTLYDDLKNVPFDTAKLLNPNRWQDRESESTLWNTFNTVQENLSKGGIRYYQQKQDEFGRIRTKRNSTREIKSINKDIKMNKALWNLTEKMAELKS